MFSKLSLLALITPLVSALTLQVPQNPTSGGQVTIKWTVEQGDPDRFSTFSFELINVAFNNAFAIANNVDPASGSLTLTLPVIPVGSGYTLQAVNIGDINDVFASTGSFSVGASTASFSSTVSVSTMNLSSIRASSAVTTASASKSSGSASASASPSASVSVSATSALASSTAPAASTAGSATGSANTAGTTPFNSGALSTRIGNTQAGIAAAFVAGAAMLAL